MRVTGEPVAASVGMGFICFAVVGAAFTFFGAKGARSPILFVCIVGGLLVDVPAALGIGIILENLRDCKGIGTENHR